MAIVSEIVYDKIIESLNNFNGLAIECESYISEKFPNLPKLTLRSIISKHGQNLTKLFYSKNHNKAAQLAQEFQNRMKNERSMLHMAMDYNCPPVTLCRIILNEKFSKADVKEMLKDPDLIPDPLLSANVYTCLFNDNQDGIIIDMIRVSIGEEYELRLKKLARDAGLIFYDEQDLRRARFDKTPDLLLAVQCMYKNTLINWIESKASFGDIESHKKYLNDQLISYTNRFGPGIVLYWFGFHEEILNKTKNLIILDSFPANEEFQKLTFQ
ncbi:hypothetical protein PVAND_011371 [Polypedilum vanderplanki]|uniref:CDAN1-interacting nuclease 1 n=1 Tax=Polypedilum vanderplanki TaxID=319348 RepID=A0A9J6CIY8_POLVA|nr:hypothetical protein PVAND_011371 [Polypedilum vanderplanki]